MFNHARTLLLNRDGSDFFPSDFPGEEPVPSDYVAFTEPSYLKRVRQILFGASPDRAMLNYRLRQYLTILHSTELAEFVTGLDSRITYDPVQPQPFFNLENRQITVETTSGNPLYFVGEHQADEALGRLQTVWTLTVHDGSTVVIHRDTAPSSDTTQSYTITDNLSSLIALPGSGLSVRFSPGVGAVWVITIYARPQRELGAIVDTCRNSLSEEDQLRLFGVNPEEPYKTFLNLWKDNDLLGYSLGGLLLAVIYRSNEIWQRGT